MEMEVANIDTFAMSAAHGDVATNQASTALTTTKHPRHRPGCTCIVCIQPPSGKGPKHNPTCTCNVCMTVKRRFKTLMMRKKKRQSEREEKEGSTSTLKESDPSAEKLEIEKGHIDLNAQPGRGAERNADGPSSSRTSMMSLLRVANLPLENYLKQNGLTSLVAEQHVSSSSVTVPQTVAADESDTTQVRDRDGDEAYCSKDKPESDA